MKTVCARLLSLRNCFDTGTFKTREDYANLWAQDPYDKSFNGVDGSVLRSMSDDQRYDSHFPEHPLSRMRRTLDALCAQQSARGAN